MHEQQPVLWCLPVRSRLLAWQTHSSTHHHLQINFLWVRLLCRARCCPPPSLTKRHVRLPSEDRALFHGTRPQRLRLSILIACIRTRRPPSSFCAGSRSDPTVQLHSTVLHLLNVANTMILFTIDCVHKQISSCSHVQPRLPVFLQVTCQHHPEHVSSY